MNNDVFILSIDKKKFESTNGLWNKLRLNDPWSVGYVSNLIERQAFNSKEEWENFYYQSGSERDKMLDQLSFLEKQLLKDELLPSNNPEKKNGLSYQLKNINLNYGRTLSDLNKKGKILFKAAKEQGIAITEVECNIAVKFRVIAQTWNGIKVREKNAVHFLKNELGADFKFKKTTGHFDFNYSVDYEIFYKSNLLCGIQIKPHSYIKSKADYVAKARFANHKKNQAYTKQFKVAVYDVIFEKELINKNIIKKINQLSKTNYTENVNDTKAQNEFWSNRYETESTGWDIGNVSTPLKTYIDQLTDKSVKILIPGAGNAYEAEYLWNSGFKNVYVLDIAKQPLQNIKQRLPDFPTEQLIQQNFFEHKGQYDLILEQTFFCSFPPTKANRNAYAKHMASLLKQNSKLVGVWFNFPLTDDMVKRPFGGDKQEYLSYLNPYFTTKTFEDCYNSIVPRAGNELFGIFVRK